MTTDQPPPSSGQPFDGQPPSAPDPDQEQPAPRIETGWVRDRLRTPEVDRFLSEPYGETVAGNFDVLRVRVARAVERIGEVAADVHEEIRARSRVHALGSIISAVIAIAAFVVALTVPAIQGWMVLLAVAEFVSVMTFRFLQRRLLHDIFTVDDLGERYRPELEAARAPEDLHRLIDRIRRELGLAQPS
jgi:hypothetical protein